MDVDKENKAFIRTPAVKSKRHLQNVLTPQQKITPKSNALRDITNSSRKLLKNASGKTVYTDDISLSKDAILEIEPCTRLAHNSDSEEEFDFEISDIDFRTKSDDSSFPHLETILSISDNNSFDDIFDWDLEKIESSRKMIGAQPPCYFEDIPLEIK